MRRRQLRTFITLPLRCPHNVVSGSACWRCGDVVPTLQGHRPWWAVFWRFFHVHGPHMLCKIGWHKWSVIHYGRVADNLVQCVRCNHVDLR